jgi:hypothetical protein
MRDLTRPAAAGPRRQTPWRYAGTPLRNRVRIRLKSGQEVNEVLAVPADLLKGMKPGMVPVTIDHDERGIFSKSSALFIA